MLIVLAAPFLLLVFAVLPGSFSRLIGAKFATGLLFCTGAVVLPVLIGLTWRAVMAEGGDLILLLAGTAFARRLGFRPQLWTGWIKPALIAFSVALSLSFVALALFATLLTGRAADSIPFVLGLLASGAALATLLSRRQEQVFTRNRAGSLVSASPQA